MRRAAARRGEEPLPALLRRARVRRLAASRLQSGCSASSTRPASASSRRRRPPRRACETSLAPSLAATPPRPPRYAAGVGAASTHSSAHLRRRRPSKLPPRRPDAGGAARPPDPVQRLRLGPVPHALRRRLVHLCRRAAVWHQHSRLGLLVRQPPPPHRHDLPRDAARRAAPFAASAREGAARPRRVRDACPSLGLQLFNMASPAPDGSGALRPEMRRTRLACGRVSSPHSAAPHLCHSSAAREALLIHPRAHSPSSHRPPPSRRLHLSRRLCRRAPAARRGPSRLRHAAPRRVWLPIRRHGKQPCTPHPRPRRTDLSPPPPPTAPPTRPPAPSAGDWLAPRGCRASPVGRPVRREDAHGHTAQRPRPPAAAAAGERARRRRLARRRVAGRWSVRPAALHGAWP